MNYIHNALLFFSLSGHPQNMPE